MSTFQNGPRTAVLDSNLLLLLICASIGFQRFRSFKRIQIFSVEDARILQDLLQSFHKIRTTAYVLAEVSNLANQLSGVLREDWFGSLAEFTSITDESHVPTQTLPKLPEFVTFGVTDAALTALTEDHVVITLEHRLSGYLQREGKNVINFNHLRPFSIR